MAQILTLRLLQFSKPTTLDMLQIDLDTNKLKVFPSAPIPARTYRSRLERPHYRLRHERTRLDHVLEDYSMTLPTKGPWRMTYPNHGFLQGFPQFATVYILATDGILALFDVGNPDELFLGHVAAFVGPVCKEEIEPCDWDYTTNRRKVKILGKRPDGTWIVVPRDTWMDEYWTKHKREGEIEEVIIPRKPRAERVKDILDELLA